MKKSAWMAQTNKRLTMFRRIFKPFAVETAEIAQLRRGQERRISRCSPRDRATGPSVTRANSEWKGNLEADSFHDPSSLESPVKYSNQTSSDNPTNILEAYSNVGTQLSNLEFVEIVEQKERINRGRDINPEPLYLSRGSRFFRVDAKKSLPLGYRIHYTRVNHLVLLNSVQQSGPRAHTLVKDPILYDLRYVPFFSAFPRNKFVPRFLFTIEKQGRKGTSATRPPIGWLT